MALSSRCIEQLSARHGGCIADRLEAMHRERDADVAAQRSTGTALILVKQQVVDDAFQETEIRLVATAGLNRARLNGAFRHGLGAGDRVISAARSVMPANSCCHDRQSGSSAQQSPCMGPEGDGTTSDGRSAADNATVRSVLVIGPDEKIKAMQTHLTSMGSGLGYSRSLWPCIIPSSTIVVDRASTSVAPM